MDDTDLSTRSNTEPVYELLAAHGFWGTKTVWPLRAKRTSAFRRSKADSNPLPDSGSTLEDAEYCEFVLRLKAEGFEIALHGPAAGNSTREEVLIALERFRSVLGVLPAVNAFHQENLENLYCGAHKLDSGVLRVLERLCDGSAYEGHLEGTPYFWGDIARDTFRYVRLPFHTIDEINTLKVNPSMPFIDGRRPYVRRWFAASDGADAVRFNRLLSESNVRRLARERGTCIIYTHFAKRFARKSVAAQYVLDPEFVRTVERVTSDPDAWFATTRDLLDRLAAVKSISLDHQGSRIQVTYTGEDPVDGVTLLMPTGMQLRDEGGRVLEGFNGEVRLPAMGPGETLRLIANQKGSQTILPSERPITRRERRQIEYRNYAGLVRSWIRDRWRYRDVMPLRLLGTSG